MPKTWYGELATGSTSYSDKVLGDAANYNQSVRFDVTDKYVGITQFDENGKVNDRVLLTPKQAKELAEWIGAHSVLNR
jgi:hypothetical protein